MNTTKAMTGKTYAEALVKDNRVVTFPHLEQEYGNVSATIFERKLYDERADTHLDAQTQSTIQKAETYHDKSCIRPTFVTVGLL